MKTFIFTLILTFGFASNLSALSAPKKPTCANMDKAIKYIHELGTQVVKDAKECGNWGNLDCLAEYAVANGLAHTYKEMTIYMNKELKCFDA